MSRPGQTAVRALIRPIAATVALAAFAATGPGRAAVPVACTPAAGAEVCVEQSGINYIDVTVTHENEVTGTTGVCSTSMLFFGLLSTAGLANCVNHSDPVTGSTTACHNVVAAGGIIIIPIFFPIPIAFSGSHACVEHHDPITGDTAIPCLDAVAISLIFAIGGVTCADVTHADDVTGSTRLSVTECVVVTVGNGCRASLDRENIHIGVSSYRLFETEVTADAGGTGGSAHADMESAEVCANAAGSSDCVAVP